MSRVYWKLMAILFMTGISIVLAGEPNLSSDYYYVTSTEVAMQTGKSHSARLFSAVEGKDKFGVVLPEVVDVLNNYLSLTLPKEMFYTLKLMAADGTILYSRNGEGAIQNLNLKQPAISAGLHLLQINTMRKCIFQIIYIE